MRALGPSLTGVGISGALGNPTLELHDKNGTVIGFNDNWKDDPDQSKQLMDLGLNPKNPDESAIVLTAAPGAYTAIVAGKNSGTGLGLVEVYRIP